MRSTTVLLCVTFMEINAAAATPSESYPTILDLDTQVERQTVVDREAGQYLGHVTTCLLEDGKTILCVYRRGMAVGRSFINAAMMAD